MIHGPSLGIEAGISAASLVVVFLSFDGMSNEPELVMQPTPTIQPEESTKVTMETFLANGSLMLGDSNAPVTLVEFGDYQCHFCNVFFHSIEGGILKNYVETGKVRMIFADYNIIGPDSVNASHGAHCANDQGMFWEYHDILYNNWTGENNGWASSENLLRFAQEIRLDADKWSECTISYNHSQTIIASNDDARALELTGTPAFFVIGPDGKVTRLLGAQPYGTFERVFETGLEKHS